MTTVVGLWHAMQLSAAHATDGIGDTWYATECVSKMQQSGATAAAGVSWPPGCKLTPTSHLSLSEGCVSISLPVKKQQQVELRALFLRSLGRSVPLIHDLSRARQLSMSHQQPRVR